MKTGCTKIHATDGPKGEFVAGVISIQASRPRKYFKSKIKEGQTRWGGRGLGIIRPADLVRNRADRCTVYQHNETG